jgi:hypothetical protein
MLYTFLENGRDNGLYMLYTLFEKVKENGLCMRMAWVRGREMIGPICHHTGRFFPLNQTSPQPD